MKNLCRPPPRKSATRAVAGLIGLIAFALTSLASASGTRPFARDDQATVSAGGSVSVLDSGATSVLDNDLDLEGDTLTARLDSDVKHGDLILNEDGTFTYTHDPNNGDDATSDLFRYKAFDGTRESRRADVVIRIVRDPVAPVITGQEELTVSEDETLAIGLRNLIVEDPDSDYPRDFTLTVYEGDNYTVLENSITPVADYVGELSVPVSVNDGLLDSPVFSLVVTVLPSNDPPFVVSPVPDQAADQGQLFELALAPHFGDDDVGDVLTYAAGGLPPSGSITMNPTTGLLSGTPQLADALDIPYEVVVTAQDLAGATAILAFRLLISVELRPDLSVSVAVEPDLVTFRDSPQWEIQIENLGPGQLGEGMLKADWFSSEAPVSLSLTQGCDISNNDSFEPTLECALTSLAPQSVTTVVVQSTHAAPGDSNVIATVTADDPLLDNNAAALSLNLPASFSSGPAQFLSVSGAAIGTGDLNGDGHPDLVVTAEETVVFWNGGDRQLIIPGSSFGAGSGGTSLVVADWNVDGTLDIVVADSGGLAVRIYLNDGAGTFSPLYELPGLNVASLVAVDLDQDGGSELVAAGSNGTSVIRSVGPGGHTVDIVHPAPGRDVAAGDLDGDGFPDLVVTDANTRAVYLLSNDGSGTTFNESALELGSVASVNLFDVDGDGALDLLLAIDDANLSVPRNLVLRNLQTGDFAEWAVVGAAPTSQLLAGEVNADGLQDLVAVNRTGVHQVYFGDGMGNFSLDDEHVLSIGMHQGKLVDINGDGSLDLILAGEDSSRIDVHANNGLGKFGLGDISAPVLSLIGSEIVVVSSGGTFLDPGATAFDDIDGDLTASIEISGSVNSTIVGNYTLTYGVSDRAGNLTEATRIVAVEPRTEGGGGGGASGWGFLIYLSLLAAARRAHPRLAARAT